MPDESYSYIIIGGGLSGASAIEGIREVDARGSILLISNETDLPYDRPPLTKQLWTGTQTVDKVFLHDQHFYDLHAAILRLGAEITSIQPSEHIIRDREGHTYGYERLLLATGGTPRRLSIPGADQAGILHYRTLRDYHKLRQMALPRKSALVIGGGFIGSEIAAALRMNHLEVTMLFPSSQLISHVAPAPLGRYLTNYYRDKGVKVFSDDVPVSIDRQGDGYMTRTLEGRAVPSDLIVVGIGITPNDSLAKAADLFTGDGVIVNEFLQTSSPDIYAAGDVAYFPESVLGPRRIEHWDNAQAQGKHAGKNMAGAQQPFTYIPFFFSDMFDFGYEAVGRLDNHLQTFADWQEENKTGAIYYLEAGHVRGVMMCNVWGKVDAARELIRSPQAKTPEELRGAIR
jgi:NADPH-dependent 2,4-dienoyl-CoA reductase/sulfur reductase-like enzyme